jgi:hypothetical protein
MSGVDRHKPLAGLITKARARHRHATEAVLAVPGHAQDVARACPFHGDRLLRLLTHSYLVWELGTLAGDAALERLCAGVVDANELRVSLVDEIMELVADPARPDPRGAERALRLKATLNDLFTRQHRLTLDHLASVSKKAAWTQLAGLAQVPRFVAARVALVGLGIHAMPVDGAMVRWIVDSKGLKGEVASELGTDEVAGLIERMVPAGELIEVYACLQASVDQASFGAGARGAGGGGAAKGNQKPAGGGGVPPDRKRKAGKPDGRPARGGATPKPAAPPTNTKTPKKGPAAPRKGAGPGEGGKAREKREG